MLINPQKKAWLDSQAWKDLSTKVYSFQAILFEEEEPRGEVIRKNLNNNKSS